jgi:hypothetical protein
VVDEHVQDDLSDGPLPAFGISQGQVSLDLVAVPTPV